MDIYCGGLHSTHYNRKAIFHPLITLRQPYVEVAITSLNMGSMSPQMVRACQQGDPLLDPGDACYAAEFFPSDLSGSQ